MYSLFLGRLLGSVTVRVSVQTFSFLFFFFFFRILGIPSSPGDLSRHLPCLTAHFVGRDMDLNKIIEILEVSRMVVLLSIPGMGKTEVGIGVSHLLKKRGYEVVIHTRVESHHQKLEDICSEILDQLTSHIWSPTADVMSLTKRKLSKRNIPTVIVLDNTENIQGEEFDEFTKWFVKSATNVKLIITTRKDVGFISADVCTFTLKPLDLDSSAELLRRLVKNFSEEHSKELAKLCGGIPLLLVTCSDSLNNGFSRELLIQQLGNNPLRLLRIIASDFYNTLQLFFNSFSDEVKRLDFVAKVLTPPKEFTALYQRCCDIAEASGDTKRHAESLNSLGIRPLCDVSHSKDSREKNQATLAKSQEAYGMRRTLPEEQVI